MSCYTYTHQRTQILVYKIYMCICIYTQRRFCQGSRKTIPIVVENLLLQTVERHTHTNTMTKPLLWSEAKNKKTREENDETEEEGRRQRWIRSDGRSCRYLMLCRSSNVSCLLLLPMPPPPMFAWTIMHEVDGVLSHLPRTDTPVTQAYTRNYWLK